MGDKKNFLKLTRQKEETKVKRSKRNKKEVNKE